MLWTGQMRPKPIKIKYVHLSTANLNSAHTERKFEFNGKVSELIKYICMRQTAKSDFEKVYFKKQTEWHNIFARALLPMIFHSVLLGLKVPPKYFPIVINSVGWMTWCDIFMSRFLAWNLLFVRLEIHEDIALKFEGL